MWLQTDFSAVSEHWPDPESGVERWKQHIQKAHEWLKKVHSKSGPTGKEIIEIIFKNWTNACEKLRQRAAGPLKKSNQWQEK
jgi:hypothetical protein